MSLSIIVCPSTSAFLASGIPAQIGSNSSPAPEHATACSRDSPLCSLHFRQVWWLATRPNCHLVIDTLSARDTGVYAHRCLWSLLSSLTLTDAPTPFASAPKFCRSSTCFAFLSALDRGGGLYSGAGPVGGPHVSGTLLWSTSSC